MRTKGFKLIGMNTGNKKKSPYKEEKEAIRSDIYEKHL